MRGKPAAKARKSGALGGCLVAGKATEAEKARAVRKRRGATSERSSSQALCRLRERPKPVRRHKSIRRVCRSGFAPKFLPDPPPRHARRQTRSAKQNHGPLAPAGVGIRAQVSKHFGKVGPKNLANHRMM
jgi:hypothetical protein